MGTTEIAVGDLFTVKSGSYHKVEDLQPGLIPLISCGEQGNGLVGFFDIPESKQYSHVLTVAYNGSWPLTTKFHPYEFGTKDDVGVLLPLEPMSVPSMLVVGAILNSHIWRYSWGRKCFKEKLEKFRLTVPTQVIDGDTSIYLPASFEEEVKTSLKILSKALYRKE